MLVCAWVPWAWVLLFKTTSSKEDLNNLLCLHFGLVCATFTMNTRHLAPCLIDPIPHCAVMGGIFHGFDAMQVNSK